MVQDLCAVVLVKGRERLAWLSQLRHPYPAKSGGGRITGSPQPDDCAERLFYYLITVAQTVQPDPQYVGFGRASSWCYECLCGRIPSPWLDISTAIYPGWDRKRG